MKKKKGKKYKRKNEKGKKEKKKKRSRSKVILNICSKGAKREPDHTISRLHLLTYLLPVYSTDRLGTVFICFVFHKHSSSPNKKEEI